MLPARESLAASRPRQLARLGCHLAAELPLVVACLANLARGWRPMFDNAAISWRAFDVGSGPVPLVGASTNPVPGSHLVTFAPGPAEFFLLAIPVHLDPAQGALWGALLVVVAAVALAVEAAWSVASWRGAGVVAGSVLWLVVTWPDAAVDPVWNPWMGAFVLLCTLAASWAAASGRLRWWPVAIGAASVAAQCHEIFAPAALGAAAAALLVGWLQGRRDGRRFSLPAVLSGLGVAIVLWLPPLLQQLTGHPGNLGQLARVARLGVSRVGVSKALTAFGAASRPFPVWMHRPPSGSALAGFESVVEVFSGSQWWAVVALGLLVVTAVIAWRSRRQWLCAAASVAVVAALGTVAALAAVPSKQFLSLVYLDVMLWPVGMAAWLTLVAAGYLALSSLRGASAFDALRSKGRALLPAVAAVLLVAGTVVATGASVGQAAGNQAALAGWRAVSQAEEVTPSAVRLAPAGRFNLVLDGRASFSAVSVLSDVAFFLHLHGAQPFFGFDQSVGLASVSLPDFPTMVLRLSSNEHPSVVVERPGHTGRSPTEHTAASSAP